VRGWGGGTFMDIFLELLIIMVEVALKLNFLITKISRMNSISNMDFQIFQNPSFR
jgi:hypothetical protein